MRRLQSLRIWFVPSPGAISMVRFDDGSDPMSWREFSSRQPETMTGD